jgi:hypothetical protein
MPLRQDTPFTAASAHASTAKAPERHLLGGLGVLGGFFQFDTHYLKTGEP